MVFKEGLIFQNFA